MRGLAEQVIVVAGGATGLGAATARRLAQEGARVVVGDLAGERAEQLAAKIRAAGGSAVAARYDAADESSVRELAALAVAEFGRLDGWHNNAADTSETTVGVDFRSDALTVPPEVWERSFAVNLRGYLYGVRAAVPLLLQRGGGAIVHTASDGALTGMPVLPAYNAAKAGVLSLSRHVATRWGREGIRSNVVAPGVVPTRRAELSEAEEARLLRRARSHRIGEPEDIAAAVAFLLSADGSWINGQVLSVNGGLVMR